MPGLWAYAAEMICPPDLRWRTDPVAWAGERLGIELWSKQREILESVRDNRMTAVHSCHGVGKSFSAALTVAWWLSVHPPNTAFVVTTAPTEPQVKAILWREINRMHRRGRLAGYTNLKEWYINGAQVGIGRKPSDHNPDAFQGIHDPYVLVVIDEACGVDESIWNAASSLLTGEDCRILAIGNPDDPRVKFADVCQSGSQWNKIHISAFGTPNFTGEKVSPQLKRQLITQTWVDERTAEWGVDTPLYISKVKGEFPDQAAGGFINLGWLRACRNVETSASDEVAGGVDIGGGRDRTVIRERRGMKAGREAVFIDADPMKTVEKIVEKINEWGLKKVNVDNIGVGWGVYGALRDQSRRYPKRAGIEKTHDAEVRGVNFGAKSAYPEKFVNKRAEVWWNVGYRMSREGLWNLENVEDGVFDELCEPAYKIVGTRVQIESKEDVIDRLKRSPDRADALLLAFYGAGRVVKMPDTAAQSQSLAGSR